MVGQASDSLRDAGVAGFEEGGVLRTGLEAGASAGVAALTGGNAGAAAASVVAGDLAASATRSVTGAIAKSVTDDKDSQELLDNGLSNIVAGAAGAAAGALTGGKNGAYNGAAQASTIQHYNQAEDENEIIEREIPGEESETDPYGRPLSTDEVIVGKEYENNLRELAKEYPDNPITNASIIRDPTRLYVPTAEQFNDAENALKEGPSYWEGKSRDYYRKNGWSLDHYKLTEEDKREDEQEEIQNEIDNANQKKIDEDNKSGNYLKFTDWDAKSKEGSEEPTKTPANKSEEDSAKNKQNNSNSDSLGKRKTSAKKKNNNKKKDVFSRPSKFRQATLKKAWDEAKDGSEPDTKLCPTCERIVRVPPGTKGVKRDWDGDHQPSWKERNIPRMEKVQQGGEIPPRKEMLDDYNNGVRLECPSCNRSRGSKSIADMRIK